MIKFTFILPGHGDVESSVKQTWILLSYDSPYENYLNNAIKIEDLNIMANSLSLQRG
ncbi:MAG: hypothetical protein IPL95_08260 [Saprospiraceae bacterium]|nr:hypothetical protein [Saprospiraceae bacterium]